MDKQPVDMLINVWYAQDLASRICCMFLGIMLILLCSSWVRNSCMSHLHKLQAPAPPLVHRHKLCMQQSHAALPYTKHMLTLERHCLALSSSTLIGGRAASLAFALHVSAALALSNPYTKAP